MGTISVLALLGTHIILSGYRIKGRYLTLSKKKALKKNLLVCFCFLCSICYPQTQIGSGIDGGSTFDLFGESVSISGDGNVAAIGAPFNGSNGARSGHVRIYEKKSGAWMQIGTDIVGEASDDQSGAAVSLSNNGKIVAIGAPGYNGTADLGQIGACSYGKGIDTGKVRIYENIGGAWIQMGADIKGRTVGDRFGISVSLSRDGNVVAIGAISNSGMGTGSGHVRIFKYGNGTWNQLGPDIGGEAMSDLSGYAVSLANNGNVVAIGAPNNDGNGLDSGHVRIYENDNGSWEQIGSDINGEAAGDRSGSSVCLSGDGRVVAIGAPNNGGSGPGSGHVRIFENNLGTWVQLGSDINGEALGDFSGTSVSLSDGGSVVGIGAHKNEGNGIGSGHVRVYQNIHNTWAQVGSDIDGELKYDYSGTAISLSDEGGVIAIGASGNDVNGKDSGKVRIYDLDSSLFQKVYQQIGQDIDGESKNDGSGCAVSLSNDGSIVAIGATGADQGGPNSGHVRIYGKVDNYWVQIGADIDNDGAGDNFGISLELSGNGNRVAIGANGNDNNGSNSGHVRIFGNMDGTWTQIGSDIVGESSGDGSGVAVSLSSDGNIVAIGANGNDNNGSNSGHVRIYTNVDGAWIQMGSDIVGESSGDGSGVAVSLSSDGNIVAIGANGNDGNGSNSGHVRVYGNVDGVWKQIGKDIDGKAAYDQGGTSVSLCGDGSIVAVGAMGNNGIGADSGHTRIFKNVDGTWTETGNITGESSGDGSGSSVSLSNDGNTVAVGALKNDGNGANSGHVRIYQNVDETWVYLKSDIDGEAAHDESGSAISLSGNGLVVAVGATGNDGREENSGHVRVFDLNDTTAIGSGTLPNSGGEVTICEGDSTTLSVSGGESYQWSTGETTASILVAPMVTTTYTVAVIAQTISTNFDFKIIVKRAPRADAGLDVAIDEGNSTVLTASGGETYLWSTGETTANITVLPSITTTYGVTVMSNGCMSFDEVVVTVNPEQCPYFILNHESFETGWGIWNDGGSDSSRNKSVTYSNTGKYNMRLRDNTSSSVGTTDNLDLGAYDKIAVDFSYYCGSMDNSNEDFWLQVSTNGGNDYSTLEKWNKNDDFVNDRRYYERVIIPGPFTSKTRFRFRADASDNQDWVYIDDITISGCSGNTNPNASKLVIGALEHPEEPTILDTTVPTITTTAISEKGTISVYPNPFTNSINIKTQESYERAEVEVFNILGQSLLAPSSRQFYNNEPIQLQNLNLQKGHYWIRMKIDGKTIVKKAIRK